MDNKSALRMKPLIVKKGNIRFNLLNSDRTFKTEDLFREDVLYDTSDMYFLKGEYQRLLLVNRFNIVSKHSRAVARYYSSDGSVTEKTSDRVTEVIGQDQFKTIFTALCSILDQELKIRSILALLTLKATDKKLTSTDSIANKNYCDPLKIFIENSCQTDEMRIEKAKPRRRIRKPVSPYIIQDVNTEEKKKVVKSKYIVPNVNIEPVKKQPKRLIINVRTLNHINPETQVKVALQNETSVTAFDDDSYQPSEHNFDPLSTAQKDLVTSLTLNCQNGNSDANISDFQSQNSNITVSLTNLDGQKHMLTDLDTQKHNFVGLKDLGYLHDDYSNDSIGKLSALSETPTNPELLTNPGSLLNNIDQHTKVNIAENWFKVPGASWHNLEIANENAWSYSPRPAPQPNYSDFLPQQRSYNEVGTDILVPYKPEDMFHIASKDNLQYLDNITKKKLLQHQLMIDFENCLTVMDENGCLPIHLAVRNNDSELLVRQCIVLKMRGCSLDIPDNGPTALKLAIESGRGAIAACLVRHGACPLRTDESHRACTHDAAEKDTDVLQAVLAACKENARKILYENEDLWKPEMEKQTDEELSQYLLKYMCSMFNKQGYNPLMLASTLGLYENVRVLIEHSPNVNDKMPTCGNTALYLAAAAACNSSIELGNKSKVVDHFRKTIELLLQNGADPSIENNYGTNVHTLLQEFNNQELSMLVANKQYLQDPNEKDPKSTERDIAKVMLVLGRDGDIQYKKLENERNKKRNVKAVKKSTDIKLVIVENVVLKPGNTASAEKGKVFKPNIAPKNLKVFQIRDNVQKGAASEKIVILPNVRKNQGLKRKQSVAPKVIKQAKKDK